MPAWITPLLTRRMLICVFTGFASGMPLYLLLNLLPAWLRTEGVSLKAIGLFALIQFPYTWKFLWAPVLDRFALPLLSLGRRRSWIFLTQLGLVFIIAMLGRLSPAHDLSAIIWLAALLALVSATADIALDAYRRELLSDQELGLGNSVHVNAYRIAGLVPGSLSLILADRLPWDTVFLITALFMLPGMLMALLIKEPAIAGGAPRSLREAVVEPFREFIGRAGLREALLILAFIFFYKLGDSMYGAGDALLSGHGLCQVRHRSGGQACRSVAGGIRWPDRRPVDGQTGDQPGAVAVRGGAGRVDLRFCLAGLDRPASHD